MFQFGGIKAVFGGAKPPKAPSQRRDWIGERFCFWLSGHSQATAKPLSNWQ